MSAALAAFPVSDPAAEIGNAVLGVLLFDEGAWPAFAGVRAEHFPDPVQARLFEAIARRRREGRAVEPLLLSQEFADDPGFRALGAGGYLAVLVDKAPASAIAPDLARQLVASYWRRALGGAAPEPEAYAALVRDAQSDFDRVCRVSPDRFRPVPFAQVEPQPIAWLVKGALPADGVAFLVGPSGSGKSFLAIDLALTIAGGGFWLDRRTQTGAVAYVAAEDANGVALRVKAWRRDHGREDVPFSLIRSAPNLLDEGDARALRGALLALAGQYEQSGHALRLIVLDTLSACVPGAEENASADMSRALAAVSGLSEETGALVLLVAHTGKDEARGIRGWSGQYANAGGVLQVERNADEGTRTLVLKKVKNGVDGARVGFSLVPVGMGADLDGDAITSCVVAYEEAAGGRMRGRDIPARLRTILTAFGACVDAGQFEPAPNVPGVPPGTKAVRRDALKARLLAQGFVDEDEKPDTAKRRINRQIEQLIDRRLIRATETHLWLV